MKDLAQAVTEKASKSLGAAGFFFEQLDLSKKYSVVPISEESFHNLATITTELPFVFVDGGNNTLLDSPSLHVSSLKFAVVTQTNVKLRAKFHFDVRSANVLISLEKIDGKKKYVIEIQSDADLPSFVPVELDDPLLANTDDNRVMTALCGHVRQMLEWHVAAKAIESATQPTLLVLDGSFSPKNDVQTKALTDLINLCASKQALCVAVSKSTALTTTGGYAIGPFLMSHSPIPGMWCTDALATATHLPFTMHFAKLAGRAEHIVRIDVSKHTGGIDVSRAIGVLAWASQDASFPGYPYGLIKADEQARVSQEEREYFATRLLLSLDPLTQRQIRMLQSSSSAHSVLDSLKF